MRQVCQMMQMTENPSKSIEPLYHRYCVAATLMYSRQKETANMPANEVPLVIAKNDITYYLNIENRYEGRH